MIVMTVRLLLASLLTLACAAASAQDSAALARELVTAKGGYVEKKRLYEEARLRAYVPILLKAVGKGPAWRPGHPQWQATEQRINDEWRKLYAGYLARMGREATYGWMDEALATAYARLFSAEDLETLLVFYRSPAGGTLIALEKAVLEIYPREMVRSLTRLLFGHETLTEREQAAQRAPENRLRRDFVELFESERIFHDEILRIGARYVDAQHPLVQQGALATGADAIDALRGKIDDTALAQAQAFVKSPLARKERAFLGEIVPAATPVAEDPRRAAEEEAVFYQGLRQLSAQWREFAAQPAAK
jgi:Uncharacterized protein conserved in bacteria (DUF2059)